MLLVNTFVSMTVHLLKGFYRDYMKASQGCKHMRFGFDKMFVESCKDSCDLEILAIGRPVFL